MQSKYNQDFFEGIYNKNQKAIKNFLSKQPNYNHSQVNELVSEIKLGNIQARDEIIRLHQSFIEYLLAMSDYKMKSKCPEDELTKSAMKGLVYAALDFEESTGFTFLAYAIWYINRSILEKIHDL